MARIQYLKLAGPVLSPTGVKTDTELWMLFYEDGTVGWSHAGTAAKGGATGTYRAAERSPALPPVVQANVKDAARAKAAVAEARRPTKGR